MTSTHYQLRSLPTLIPKLWEIGGNGWISLYRAGALVKLRFHGMVWVGCAFLSNTWIDTLISPKKINIF